MALEFACGAIARAQPVARRSAASTTVHAALGAMCGTRTHLAVGTDGGAVLGVITPADVLRRVFPEPAAAGA